MSNLQLGVRRLTAVPPAPPPPLPDQSAETSGVTSPFVRKLQHEELAVPDEPRCLNLEVMTSRVERCVGSRVTRDSFTHTSSPRRRSNLSLQACDPGDVVR